MKTGVPKSRNRIAPPHEDKGADGKTAWAVFAKNASESFLELLSKPQLVVILDSMEEYMQEYASTERNRAIQECIDCFNGMFLVPPSDTVEVAKQMKESYYKMLKLKTS